MEIFEFYVTKQESFILFDEALVVGFLKILFFVKIFSGYGGWNEWTFEIFEFYGAVHAVSTVLFDGAFWALGNEIWKYLYVR